MKVLHIVNVADAQSIPLELALAIRSRRSTDIVAAYYAQGEHPEDHAEGTVVVLGARKALDRRAIGRLRELIRRERPDIVHMHHTISAAWSTLSALLSRPRPLLVKTEHNDHRFMPPYQHLISFLIYPFVTRIVCNSDTTLASFHRAEAWLFGRKRQRIYNGVDLARVRHAASSPPVTGMFRLGTVGRLVPQKNHVRLIQGLAEARRSSGMDIRLEIIGHGPLLASLRKTVCDCGIEAYVSFLGGMPRQKVYERLSTWDGFVMASNFEGFCNALVEAIAAGLPVAVSDIETLREVAGPGNLYFDPKDPASIGAVLTQLTARSRTDGSAADKYDISLAVTRHTELYKEIARPGYRHDSMAVPTQLQGSPLEPRE